MEVIVQSKRNLYIVGAGDFGRELESWLSLIPLKDRDWELKGYIDDDLLVLDNILSDYKVLSSIDDFVFEKNDYVAIAVTECNSKEKIYNRLKGKAIFFTFISPSAILGKNVEIGEGVIICPNSIIANDTIISKLVMVNLASQVGHDCVVGDFSSIMSNVVISGRCKIEERVFIGSGATVIPQRKIKKDIKIAAAAAVFRNLIKPGTYIGNPAKKL